jgi:hypothetical protein
MELEKEIEIILKEMPGGMTVQDIARQLMEKGVMNDNDSSVCYFQVHARTHNMPDMFERKGEKVKLKNQSGLH